METAIAAVSHALDAPPDQYHFTQDQLDELHRRSGSFGQPPQLNGSFDQQHLDGSFEPPQHLASPHRGSPAFETHSRKTSFDAPESADMPYLGSPPRHGSNGSDILNRAVGSPAARTVVGSPGLRHQPSPLPQQQQQGRLSVSPQRGALAAEAAVQQQQHDGTNGSAGSGDGHGAVEHRKLVILGLPWDTSEATMQTYFAQFGPIEEAVIMKDRYTGKSRGFGFVTFAYAEDAGRVISSEHHVDGRRCEAKLAVPRGGANPNRTTRVFVARIPPAVTDDAFRAHFAAYGAVQDAYMPKDASKLGHRGIGFVTFASPDAVERVMSATHVLLGQELAIDRATPKDRSPPPSALSAGRGGSGSALPGYAGSAPFGMGTSLLAGLSPAAISAAAGAAALSGGSLGAAAGQAQLAAMLAGGGLDMDSLLQANGLGAVGSSNNMQALQGLQGLMPSDGMQLGLGMPSAFGAPSPHSRSGMRGSLDIGGDAQARRASMDVPSDSGGNSAAVSHGGGGGSVTSGLDANAGPRIFVGKLNRATTEADVREYFTRFGYVMDVYMPRDKHNRHEHRGFGFVTFETDAAVHRVAAHGLHQIRGAAVAIDSAVPRREEAGGCGVGGGGEGYHGLAAAMNIIDIARGDAGPLRHQHASIGMRYRPYMQAPQDVMPGAY